MITTYRGYRYGSMFYDRIDQTNRKEGRLVCLLGIRGQYTIKLAYLKHVHKYAPVGLKFVNIVTTSTHDEHEREGEASATTSN